MLRPFFSRQLKDFVVDEMCECGHAKSEHGSSSTNMDGQIVRLSRDEGSCCSGQCACPRFTWARYITETEAVQQALYERPRKAAS